MSGAAVVVIYMDGPHRMFHRTHIMVSAPIRLQKPAEGLTAAYLDTQTHMLEQRMTMNALIAER